MAKHRRQSGMHGDMARAGRYVSRRSAAASTARRTRWMVMLTIAVIVLCAAAMACVFAMMRRPTPTSVPRAAAPMIPSHESLLRGTAPQQNPGNIIIGVNGSETTYVLKGERYVEGGAHAIEPDGGVLTPDISASGSVDTNAPGDYTVRYTVHDSHGHIASTTRTVKVVDAMDKQTGGIPVLMYHYVYDPANPPERVDANWIPTTSLEPQLQYLTQHGFYFPSWPEVRAFIDGTHSLPKRSIVMTFDDGEPHFLQFGVPLLAKYQVPTTSFIIGADADAVDKMAAHATPYLEYESHSFDMHRAGGTVGHGGRISAMSRQEIVDDLTRTGQIVGSMQAFAYPFGDTTPDAQKAVKEAGVPLAFTTKYGWANIGADPTVLPRVRIQGTGSLETFVAAIQ